MQHENLTGECTVQTRMESVVSISKRQNEDLREVAIRFNQTLSRLRGNYPQMDKETKPNTPEGLLAEMELSLQTKDEVITFLFELEKELRSLI